MRNKFAKLKCDEPWPQVIQYSRFYRLEESHGSRTCFAYNGFKQIAARCSVKVTLKCSI